MGHTLARFLARRARAFCRWHQNEDALLVGVNLLSSLSFWHRGSFRSALKVAGWFSSRLRRVKYHAGLLPPKLVLNLE
jgi:hypothetical protein